MLSIYFRQSFSVSLYYSVAILCSSSSLVVDLVGYALGRRFSWYQTCSIGFKSGLQAGQFIIVSTEKPCLLNHCLVITEVFCGICTYLSTIDLHYIWFSLKMPLIWIDIKLPKLYMLIHTNINFLPNFDPNNLYTTPTSSLTKR